MAEDKVSIKVLPNGPLVVTNLRRLCNSRGEPIQIKKVLSLCRCGASKNKPFCDGAHTASGFSDKKYPDRVEDTHQAYPGQEITIHDNRGICSHAGYCTSLLPSVFQAGTEPWIDPGGASVEQIRSVIDRCPSGALRYSVDGTDHGNYDRQAEIQISKNGPYRIRGEIALVGHPLGEFAPTEHYTLCRCGHSKNKPRCDGSHWYAAFVDDEARTIAQANRKRAERAPEWVKVAERDELDDGQTKTLTLWDQPIVVARVGDKVGATEGVCSHQGGPLGDGPLDQGVLRCPWHGHPFDPLTGKSLAHDPDLRSFQVEKRKDGIYLQMEAPQKSGWTISHVVAETMVNWGISHVFGMVGHSNLGLAEALRVQEEKGKLTYIGIRHEGAAAFACSGYAKVTGRPAACLTIAGPGATNLITGLWDAKMDRAPVLALTGQISTQFLGPGAFQEIDLASAFDAVADFSKVVLPNSDPAELVSLALKSAIVQRNVAHLIVPDEVQIQDAKEAGPASPDGRVSDTRITPSKPSVDLALYRLAHARRPVIIVGYGARDCMPSIVALAEKLHAPILTTFKAKGQISDHHPLGCGVLGRSGTPVSSWYMNNADLLVVFGASFSQHTGIDQTKPLIQVDFDRMALGKFHPIDTPIWGEIDITARLFLEHLPQKRACQDCRQEIQERWRAWREEKKRRAQQVGSGLAAAYIMQVLSDAAPKDALFSLDVGNNTYSFGRYFECHDQRVILCGYLGSIGFAFPAAMGAWAAGTKRPVLSVSGDGGFAQYMGEFNTAVRYDMDITHVLLNNGELGKISKEQRDGKWPVWQTELSNPNFAQYAQACGGMGIRVDDPAQLPDALQTAIAHQGPALVDIVTDPELN